MGFIAFQNQNIKQILRSLTAFNKIIVVNVVLYILGFVLIMLFKDKLIFTWLEIPAAFSEFIYKPWTLFTYGFVHYSFLHILFNMLVLYYVSTMLLNLFRVKTLLNVYWLGIACGGLFFLTAYNVLPNTFIKYTGALVGASAGIRALILFLSTYFPAKEVRVFTFFIKLKHIGFALVLLDVLGLFAQNQGGYIAHLGGDFVGFFYAKKLVQGVDIGKGFERLIDRIVALFNTKSSLKTVYKTKEKEYAGYTKNEFNEFNKQKKIDLILDKISKSGYDSLTKEEKEFLFKVGN